MEHAHAPSSYHSNDDAARRRAQFGCTAIATAAGLGTVAYALVAAHELAPVFGGDPEIVAVMEPAKVLGAVGGIGAVVAAIVGVVILARLPRTWNIRRWAVAAVSSFAVAMIAAVPNAVVGETAISGPIRLIAETLGGVFVIVALIGLSGRLQRWASGLRRALFALIALAIVVPSVEFFGPLASPHDFDVTAKAPMAVVLRAGNLLLLAFAFATTAGVATALLPRRI